MTTLNPDISGGPFYGPIGTNVAEASVSRKRDYLALAIERIMLLTPKALRRVLDRAEEDLIDFLYTEWALKARHEQIAPNTHWLVWLLLGGRGSGKTRAGAEWIQARVKNGARRVALVGPTFNEAREVMVEGESGLLNIGEPEDRPVYYSSRKRLEWPNGAIGQVFSSEDPDGLRGAQCDTAWADEYCAWQYPRETLSNLRLGLRLTSDAGTPQLTVTTTPKPTQALRTLLKTTGSILCRMRTEDNKNNLAAGFVSSMTDTYGGTRLGRQELDGEIMTDHLGALWTRHMIARACRNRKFGHAYRRSDYGKVIIAIDPPVTSGPSSDACGIIVAGIIKAKAYGAPKAAILFDGTVQGRSPENWAAQVARLFSLYEADYLLAEANQGGEMVRSVLRQAGEHMAVRLVHASKSKADRASPVALTYEQGRVHHMARFPELEDQLCQIGADEGNVDSPDRADALVWAVTELLLTARTVPRVRSAVGR